MTFIAKPSPRDRQRGKLYAAEREVAAFLRDNLPTIMEIQAYVDSILRSPWLQGQFGSRMLSPITVRGGRSKRQRDADAHSFMSEISMPKALRSKFVVIHETCHIITERFYGQDMTESHGPEFATFLLMLVGYFLGPEDRQDLLEGFTRNGVAHSYRGEEQ